MILEGIVFSEGTRPPKQGGLLLQSGLIFQAVSTFCLLLVLTSIASAQASTPNSVGGTPAPIVQAALATGKVEPRVSCASAPDQTYALYLPSNYTPTRKWPIMYAFDPSARGEDPVVLMKDAAEKYGYILVGSNNSKNGASTIQTAAAQAVWQDTHERFAIDEHRTYTTGFSGGARVATDIALRCNCIAGVYASGAGFPSNAAPSRMMPFVYFGAVGDVDFNYTEMLELSRSLDNVGATSRLRIFDGPHQWAPAEVAEEAFAWFQLQAMRAAVIPKDEAFIDQRFKRAIEQSQQTEQSGDAYALQQLLRKIVQDFSDLKDVTAFASKAEQLKATKEFKQGERRRQTEISKQRDLTANIFAGLGQIESSPTDRSGALSTLQDQVSTLRRAADNGKGTDKKIAERALRQVLVACFERGANYLEERNTAMALIYGDLLVELSPTRPGGYLEKARTYAVLGDKKKALAALKLSADNGLQDPELLSDFPEFKAIAEEQEFHAIMERVGKPN